jgi:hypothetical protein
MRRITLWAVTCVALMLTTGHALGQGGSADKKAAMSPKKAPMSTFLIVSPHTAEECLAVMDEVNKTKELTAWDWGCMSGNHTAYRTVKAADENAALAMVPESVRAKAQVYKVTKMTPAMLETAHKGHM